MINNQELHQSLNIESQTITQENNESETFPQNSIFKKNNLKTEENLFENSFKKQSPLLQFHKLDEESSNFIAEKIFKKYSSLNKIENNGIQRMITDAYKIINKNHIPEDDEISHYIDHHNNGDDKNYLSVQDIQKACKKYLVGPKGYGISLFNRNVEETIFEKLFKELNECQIDDLEKCRELFNKYDSDQDGFLVKSDIQKLLLDTYQKKEKKLNIDEENVEHYFSLLDRDDDKKVNYQEFESYFIKAMNYRNISFQQIKFIFQQKNLFFNTIINILEILKV